MKKLITIITICLMMNSCTEHVNIKCPCVVIGNDGLYITVQSTGNATASNGRFEFKSNYNYQIGDTIQ